MDALFRLFKLILIFFICTAATCSVKLGQINIPATANTFFIPIFQSTSPSAPSDLGVEFTETFRDKVRRETRLSFSDVNPDLEFLGSVQSFQVTAVAPQPGETTQYSRLTIRVKIDYIDNEDEKNNWNRTFSHFVDFDANQNLLDVQDDLVDQIFEQISQDIFQEAFGKW